MRTPAHGEPHRVAFATAVEWVIRLREAHDTGRIGDELRRLGRIPLLVIDEAGYIPFEPEAANLSSQFPDHSAASQNRRRLPPM